MSENENQPIIVNIEEQNIEDTTTTNNEEATEESIEDIEEEIEDIKDNNEEWIQTLNQQLQNQNQLTESLLMEMKTINQNLVLMNNPPQPQNVEGVDHEKTTPIQPQTRRQKRLAKRVKNK